MSLSRVSVTPLQMDVTRRNRRKSRNAEIVLDLEDSELYKLIHEADDESWIRALELTNTMAGSSVRQKSKVTGNTYFHEVVLSLTDLYKKNGGNINVAIVLIYRLAICGCDVNVQNDLGHTPLHLACFRPKGDLIVTHLLRLGVDPCLENNAGYRVFVDNETFECYLIKNQPKAYCSLWQAVAKEDFDLIEKLMLCWFRINTKRKRKTLLDVAYDTGNYKTVEKLMRYQNTNELVIAAFGCDSSKVFEYVNMRFEQDSKDTQEYSNKPDINTKNHAGTISVPLIEALKELSPFSDSIIEILEQGGATEVPEYKAQLLRRRNIFNQCHFYDYVNEMTANSILNAWHIVHNKEVDLNALSSDGNGYLHLLVQRYCECEDLTVKRILVRLMYKLVLEGIKVNHRNNKGETAVITAFRHNADRILLDYLINMGVDTSYRCRKGQCISINNYATRGQLILTHRCDRTFLPGLWPAVEDNDLDRVKFWLTSLCRVNSKKAGRNMLQYAKDHNFNEVAELLEKYLYLTEFSISAMAADVNKMKHCLAMGQGISKVNAAYCHFFAGFTDDWKVEFVQRPILVSIMENCPAEITYQFIKFGVNLHVHYEEVAPCAPIAFWAFRDDIDESVTKVVSEHADLEMRDEHGSTLLHKAIMRKGNLEKKKEIIIILLERGINIAARDIFRRTARDCCNLEDVQNGLSLMTIIDDYVLNMVYEENYDGIEELVIQGYDHITDICGTVRNKTAVELANLRYFKELIDLLQNIDIYQQEIQFLHGAVITNNTQIYTKFLSEKKVAWGVDSRGRNILHLAVLYRHAELVSLICDQFPQLISQSDCLLRTPVHYAVCLKDQRQMLSIISMSNSINLNIKDANNMSALDYIAELDSPTPVKNKTRGRRTYNYDIRNLVLIEKEDAEKDMIRLDSQVNGSVRNDTFVTDQDHI